MVPARAGYPASGKASVVGELLHSRQLTRNRVEPHPARRRPAANSPWHPIEDGIQCEMRAMLPIHCEMETPNADSM